MSAVVKMAVALLVLASLMLAGCSTAVRTTHVAPSPELLRDCVVPQAIKKDDLAGLSWEEREAVLMAGKVELYKELSSCGRRVRANREWHESVERGTGK